MNTIEFAVQDGVPYAIDFLNPAPDFERDRITPISISRTCVEKMTRLVIDRALNGDPSQTLAAVGGDARASARPPASSARPGTAVTATQMDADRRVACAAAAGRSSCAAVHADDLPAAMRERKLTFGDRLHCPFLRPFFLDRRRRGADARRGGDASPRSASA